MSVHANLDTVCFFANVFHNDSAAPSSVQTLFELHLIVEFRFYS